MLEKSDSQLYCARKVQASQDMKTMYCFSLTKPLEFQGNTVRQSSRQTGSYDPQSDLGAAWPERHEKSWKTEHLIKNNHKDSAIFSTSACSTDRSWMGKSMLLFCLSSTAWLILVMQHLNQRYYWWQKKKKKSLKRVEGESSLPSAREHWSWLNCYWRLPAWWAHLWGDFRWSLRGKKHFFSITGLLTLTF